MKVRHIKKLPIFVHMSAEIKEMRQNAPKYLQWIVAKPNILPAVKSLEDMSKGAIKALGGGMLSAVYHLRHTSEHLVIKFRPQGVKAEAESLAAWRKVGARVIEVKLVGKVTFAKNPIKYLVQRAVTFGDSGRLAPTLIDYAAKHPDKVTDLGRALGEELATMHRAKSGRTFGEFGDMWGKIAPWKSWNNYLLGYVSQHHDFLRKEIGFSEQSIVKLEKRVKNIPFPKSGVYIHGDYSLRNAVLERENPIRIRVFDPNPLIGDPSWDLAVLYNNDDFSRRRLEKDENNSEYRRRADEDRSCLEGVIKGYEAASKSKIDRLKVWTAQFMQMTFLTRIEYDIAEKNGKNPKDEIECQIRKEALQNAYQKLVHAER